MNNISKRLLSWLCVIAMVLSFVPVMDLSDYVVITRAADEPATVTKENTDTDLTQMSEDAEYQRVLAIAEYMAEYIEKTEELPAECPLCTESVSSWTVVSGDNAEGRGGNGKHVYLTGDVNHTSGYFMTAASANKAAACLFTNGFNITSTVSGKAPIWGSTGTLNVVAMGANGKQSVIQGNGTQDEDQGTTVACNSGAKTVASNMSIINLYGGIYEKYLAEGTTESDTNVIAIHGNSGDIRMYGVTVNAGTKGSAIYINGEVSYDNCWVTMYSGKIDGSKTNDYTVDIEASHAISHMGDGDDEDYGYYAKFEMHGGEIVGGKKSAVNMQNTPSSGSKYGARGSVFNLFGGTITGGTVTGSGAAVRQSASYTVTVSGTKYTATPVFNMSGGLIQGGTVGSVGEVAEYPSDEAAQAAITTLPAVGKSTSAHAYSGNAGWGGSCYLDGEANISGGVIRGGTAIATYANKCTCTCKAGEDGEPVYTYTFEKMMRGGSGGNIYASGKMTITGGTIENGTGYLGGNIYRSGNSLTIDTNVTVQNGTATSKGGNLYTTKSTTIKGKLIGGSASSGGSVYNIATLTIKGGTIDGGTATGSGGAIYSESTLNVTSGTVKNGIAASSGGNVYSGGSKATIGASALIQNGQAKYGGNIYVSTGSVETSGKILDGKAKLRGGNIDVNSYTLTINGGVIANGELTAATGGAHWGGNIRCWNGTVIMNDGLVYGGKGAVSNKYSNNIGIMGDNATKPPQFTMTGGTVVGDIGLSAKKDSFNGTTVTISGSPKIVTIMMIENEIVKPSAGYGIKLNAGNEIDITDLNSDAIITVSASKGQVITQANENAAQRVHCFFANNSDYAVDVKADNTLYLVSAVASHVNKLGKKLSYRSNADAVADYNINDGGYLILAESAVIDKDVVVQLAGEDLTLTGSGKVYGLDSSNDDYDGYAKLTTVGEGVDVQRIATNGDKRYVAVKENDGTWGFHRVEVKLNAVSLRSAAAGLYYKATYACDETLAGCVDTLGVALGVESVPAELGSYTHKTAYTAAELLEKYKDHKVENVTSGSVFGILKETNEAAANAANLEQDIYAKAYMALKLDGETVYVTSQESAWSLLKVLEAVDQKFTGLTEGQQNAFKQNAEIWQQWLEGEFNLADKLPNTLGNTAQ